MTPRIHTLVAVALCALSLSAPVAPMAHAQGGPKVLVTAKPSKVYVDAVVQTSQNGSINVGMDQKLADSINAQFSDTDWTWTDDKQMVVTKGGKGLVRAIWFGDPASYMLVHLRTDTMIVSGNVQRVKDDPSRGYADLYINVVGQNGATAMFNVFAPLTFATQQTPGGGGDGGGFGGFGN
jgi:hypothetical protein